MNNLTIQPCFKSRYVKHVKQNSCNKVSQKFIQTKNVSPDFEFSKFWNYVDKFVVKKIEQLKSSPLSQEPFCQSLEIRLKKEDVNVRFKNNIKLAKYIEAGIEALKTKNIPLPKNIIFTSSLMSLLGILGLTYMLRSDKKESPIILPKNVASQTKRIEKSYQRGEISTPNPLHTFLHEVGHWLHYQRGFNILKNAKTWQKVDIKQVEKEVSKLATRREDGSELYAEVFAASIDNIEYSPQIKKLVKKLDALL